MGNASKLRKIEVPFIMDIVWGEDELANVPMVSLEDSDIGTYENILLDTGALLEVLPRFLRKAHPSTRYPFRRDNPFDKLTWYHTYEEDFSWHPEDEWNEHHHEYTVKYLDDPSENALASAIERVGNMGELFGYDHPLLKVVISSGVIFRRDENTVAIPLESIAKKIACHAVKMAEKLKAMPERDRFLIAQLDTVVGDMTAIQCALQNMERPAQATPSSIDNDDCDEM